jgi:hypothetical protein
MPLSSAARARLARRALGSDYIHDAKVKLPVGISLGVLDLQLTHATVPSTAAHGAANQQD